MKAIRRLAAVATVAVATLAVAAPAQAETGPITDVGQCVADTTYFVEYGLDFYLPRLPGNPGEAFWMG